MALTKEQRSERARLAANARWSKAGDAGRRAQRLRMVRAHATALGYQLVPIDDNTTTAGTDSE